MKTTQWFGVMLGLSLFATQSFANDLKPLQIVTFDLGAHTAMVFYEENNGEYEVTTTVGPNMGYDGPITRHVVNMSPGQDYSVSVGNDVERTTSIIRVETSDSGVQVAMK
ncbi:MAG: hypothetical protein OER96_11630 [Gammaproteobacteria bacterium]|nr:hypothetical protein [Gammaproteobacteria bacterium]